MGGAVRRREGVINMATDTAMVNATRNLPLIMTSEVERLGYSILRGLDRLGFVHETKDGGAFAIRFDAVRLYGETWAAYHVDAERLYHFSVADLAKPAVLAQLSAVTHKPVRSYADGGLAYVVELQPKSKVRLPGKIKLDLDTRPAGELLVPLGVGRDGPVWMNFHKIGHALIVGTTGSGKSTWLHSALASLLTGAGPDQLRLALIDPKRSELTTWANAPHLIGEIASTEQEATALLSGLAQEIDRRGGLFGAVLVRDLGAYNRKTAEPLPYILCVIDECLDLVLSAGAASNLTNHLKTIAIRGRSAGVILWAATQHAASVTGLPRVVNTNLTARLVFRVADRSAADVAGCPGAESLPRDRPGRLIAKIDGGPAELQGFYLADDALLSVARGLAAGVTGPMLTETEQDLLTWAANENGGALALADIRARAGIGPREARRLADKLEARGWIQKDKMSSNRRALTEQGRTLAQNADKPTSPARLTNQAANRQSHTSS